MKLWLAPLLLLANAAVGAQEEAVRAEHERHDFGDVERWVENFESPERLKWQKPLYVMTVLGVDEGDRVADIGAGTGYFTRFLSTEAADDGKVYAIDVEQKMLDYIEQRKDVFYDNVVTVLAEPDDPKLPAGELDLILIVNTWHHIENRTAYLKKLATALDVGGRVVIVDWLKQELPMGPPPAQKLSREQVVGEAAQEGWTVVSELIGLPYQYLVILYPPR